MVAAIVLAVLSQQDRLSWTFDAQEILSPAWRQATYSGQATFQYAIRGRTTGCVEIASTNGADASWSIDAPVQPGSYYKLSGWVRAEGVTGATGALLNVHQVAGATTKAVTGDSGWTQVETVFRTGARTSVQINCLFGGWGQSRGRAFYDDIVLERIDMQDFPGPVTIDVNKTREPISKYIYGQFIEHLGKCIYGGIWAEMLEDRKFYYPIEGKEPYQRMREGYERLVASPWSVGLGNARLVKSDYREQPVLELSGVLDQRGLTTLPGMRYKVRVTYKGWIRLIAFQDSGSQGLPQELRSDVWTTTELEITAGQTSGNTTFFLACPTETLIAAVSLMPADNIDGFRRDTIELLKQLDAPIYRWPGGNFVSGYEWRDGIGDRDKRPTIPNPAWTGIDTNDVGTHEFIRFCELINTEPLIVVNTGFGDPFSAAQWVEYCNSPISPPPSGGDSGNPLSSPGERGQGVGGNMAALRKQNGSEKPFNVRWWGIGNEMYGNWQLGHVPVAQYVTKHNMTVDRMKAVDPTIKTIAVGETGPWDEAMLRQTRHNMTLLSEHIYVQERQDVIEHTRLLPEAIRRKADWHRRFQPTLQQEKVKISMDEWNYWYGPYLYGELGTRYFWKDGMGIASGLHEFFRNTDVYEMAQYAQTVNVIGAIKTTPTHAEFETTGLVLMMYRKHFGTIPVSVEGVNPDLGLDIVAALTQDRKTLTIAIVNPFDREMTVPLRLAPLLSGGEGSGVRGSGTLFTIAHNDPMAYNEPGQPRRVNLFQSRWEDSSKLTVPKHSVTIARISLQ
ncbi:MAG: alpha-L-arabinofuranosidase C-terminal domain-containing protein [Fimbriimonadaceae bacterium]